MLSKDFHIAEQVKGTHFSKAKLCIDAIVRPKDTCKWKNPDVCLGIEFKLEEKLKDTKDKTLWVKQCIDYANTRWDNYDEYLYIFSCPSIFYLDNVVKGDPWLWNRILSNLGVGRLDLDKNHGWTFYLQDSHRIWSENEGVAQGKNWALKRKFGRAGFKHI